MKTSTWFRKRWEVAIVGLMLQIERAKSGEERRPIGKHRLIQEIFQRPDDVSLRLFVEREAAWQDLELIWKGHAYLEYHLRKKHPGAEQLILELQQGSETLQRFYLLCLQMCGQDSLQAP